MNCPLLSADFDQNDATDLLLEYTAGRLDSARAALLERHMEKCARCAAFRTEQAMVWNALDAWEPEPVSLSFNRSLWQRIDAIAAEPWYVRLIDGFRFGAWKPALPLAAAMCVITAGFVLDHAHAPTASSVAGASGVSITEVDQAEKALDDIQLLRQLDSASHPESKNSKTM
jgi:anti-sigma factor RsiW